MSILALSIGLMLSALIGLATVLSFADLRAVLAKLDQRRPTPVLVHEGATEDYGRALYDMRRAHVSDDLATESERMVTTHDEFSEVWRALLAGLDNVCDPICEQLDPHWARVDAPTGEYRLVSAT